jgi:hypothetical protein
MDGYWFESPYLSRSQADCIACLDCRAWLSLGPSNDEPEAVRIEIRAAEIAAGAKKNLFEAHGYNCPGPDQSCLTFHWYEHQCGALARCIVTHDEGESLPSMTRIGGGG